MTSVRRPSVSHLIAGVLWTLAIARPAGAHDAGERYGLPAPLWLWVVGAALAVAAAFVLIERLVRRPVGSQVSYPRFDLLRWRAGRLLVDPRLWLAGQALAIALLALIVAAGAIGVQNPNRNLAPTAIWVVWWLGFAYVSTLIGDVWKVLNPWSAAFAWCERWAYGGHRRKPPLTYPEALGAWPAVALLVAFAWTDLVFEGRAVPAQLALITVGYSIVTWLAMMLFGRWVWLRHGDPVTLTFGLLARFAPTELRVSDRRRCRECAGECKGQRECINCLDCFSSASHAERELNVRPFAAGLTSPDGVPSSVAIFVLVLLASLTFDGFMATPPWSAIESTLYRVTPGSPDLRISAATTAGLLASVVLLTLVCRAGARGIALAGDGPSTSRISRVFVLALIPIVVASHVAHHSTRLLVQGPRVVPLVSDPFGLGWNLLGTADLRADGALVGPRFAWYTALVAIVVGHVIAVYVAHLVAVREFADRGSVVRSEIVAGLLVIAHTVASLWIIAQPLVEWNAPG